MQNKTFAGAEGAGEKFRQRGPTKIHSSAAWGHEMLMGCRRDKAPMNWSAGATLVMYC